MANTEAAEVKNSDNNVQIMEGASTSTNMDDSYWQLDCTTLAQQNEYLLKNATHSDCTFIVGKENKQRFECHKLLMAKASPVFEAMLYRPLSDANNDDIEIVNMEPQVFDIIRRYIYTGVYELTNLATAFHVAQNCDVYMLPELQNKAYENLLGGGVDFAVEAWELAVNNNTKVANKLLQRAIKLMVQYTDELVSSESFLTAEHSTILHIAQQVALHATEPQIITGCENWAERQAKNQGITETNPQILRKILGDVFSYLRFLSLGEKDVEIIQKTALLTKDEKNTLLERIKSKSHDDVWFFKGFSDIDTDRIYLTNETITPKFIFEKHITNFNTSYPEHVYNSDAGGLLEMEFKVDHDIILLGFETYTQWNSPNWDLKIKNERGIEKDIGDIYGTVNIKFENPIIVCKNDVHYLYCKIKKGKEITCRHGFEISDLEEQKVEITPKSFIKFLVYAIL